MKRVGPNGEDRVVGFELGADDYVTKPFSPRELRAFLQTLEPGSAIRQQSAGR